MAKVPGSKLQIVSNCCSCNLNVRIEKEPASVSEMSADTPENFCNADVVRHNWLRDSRTSFPIDKMEVSYRQTVRNADRNMIALSINQILHLAIYSGTDLLFGLVRMWEIHACEMSEHEDSCQNFRKKVSLSNGSNLKRRSTPRAQIEKKKEYQKKKIR
jgi:hypothetical protein